MLSPCACVFSSRCCDDSRRAKRHGKKLMSKRAHNRAHPQHSIFTTHSQPHHPFERAPQAGCFVRVVEPHDERTLSGGVGCQHGCGRGNRHVRSGGWWHSCVPNLCLVMREILAKKKPHTHTHTHTTAVTQHIRTFIGGSQEP